MRIQLIILTLIFSLSALAVDDKSMKELFRNYDLVMDDKKIELIDDVFTKRFIQESGGKEELIEKIKGLTPPSKTKSVPQPSQVSWKKGQKGQVYLAKLKSSNKSSKSDGESEFIILIEDGKPKIDGTMSDAD